MRSIFRLFSPAGTIFFGLTLVLGWTFFGFGQAFAQENTNSSAKQVAPTVQAGQTGPAGQTGQAVPSVHGEGEHWEQVKQFTPTEPEWVVLEDGLENTSLLVLPMENATQAVSVNVLRIEPEKWDFELLMASEHGQAESLGLWAEKHDLVAAINASMYLPDGKTSTGYMRRAEHANNERIVTNFGAFFVAMPKTDQLPQAAMLDRHDDNWQDELDSYKIVVQNYRLMTPQGKPLWGATPLNSLAAVGQDKAGRILFLHCGQPRSAIAFVEGLTRLPLGLVRLMYVEGGYQAAMLVNTKVKNEVWTGRYAALLDSNAMPPLPNVIGIKRKSVNKGAAGISQTNSTVE